MAGDRANKRDNEDAHAPTAVVGAEDTAVSVAAPINTPKIDRASLPPVLAARYELKRVIGSGGMGLVYEALDLNLHRLVALKVLKLAPTKPEERADAVGRLVREARAMAALSHKNVVTVHDVGNHEDQIFVAMQLSEGTTMRQWLNAEKRSVHQILHVMFEAGSGLAAAHAARLIHRDFKPDNILVSQRGSVRVTDFGLARRADGLIEPTGIAVDRVSAPGKHLVEGADVDVTSVTRSGAIVGTPAYMAPEQAQGAQCDARADQFSFCVTAWEALFGARPFGGKNWSEIFNSVQTQQYVLPPIDRKAPRVIQRALRKGLSVDPKDRFASMDELLEVFAVALRAPVRRRWIAFFAGAIVAVIAAVIISRNVGTSSEAPKPAVVVEAPVQMPTSTMPAPDLSTRNMQLALRNKPRLVIEQPAAPPATEPPKPPPAKKIVKSTTEKPPVAAVTPQDPKPDPKVDALRATLAGLDAEYKKRELLASDLPASYAAAKQAASEALAANDTGRAQREIETARAAIAAVKIDRAFVDQKVQRINATFKKLPPDRQTAFGAKLNEVLSLFGDDKFLEANRKINELARALGSS
jgi:serine/threonine protein kinase